MAKIKPIRDSLFKEYTNARVLAHEEKMEHLNKRNYDKGSKWKGGTRWKLSLSGRITDSNRKKLKDAIVSLHHSTDMEILKSDRKTQWSAEVRTHHKSGKYKFDELQRGEYLVRAYHPIHGSVEKIVSLDAKLDIGDMYISREHELFKKDWLSDRNKLILNHISSTNKESQFSRPITSEYIDELIND